MQLTDTAQAILKERYLHNGETPDGMLQRVALTVAEAAPPEEREEAAAEHYDLMANLHFLPNSPTLVNAGREKGCLSACFVLSPEDNMESIGKTISDAMMVSKWGGGIGFGFSKLRPKGDAIASTHKVACGPISVMEMISFVNERVTQGSFRQGAHMGQLHITHPDILDFIVSKRSGLLSNFNISVQIPDSFMEDLRARPNTPHLVTNPATKERWRIGKTVKQVWDMICEEAWNTGDPGVVFIDRVHETAPNPELEAIQTSNPCGEEFLENYGSCNLGSLNLTKFVKHGKFDWLGFHEAAYAAVRFLDHVIDVNTFPLPALRHVNQSTRRIGLGVMGWTDALDMMGMEYDSGEARTLARAMSLNLTSAAKRESARLADRYGAYPIDRARNGRKKNLRHSSLTTIAPTGSISRIAGVSSGIEPHMAEAWVSRILWKSQDAADTREFFDAPLAIREAAGTSALTVEDLNALAFKGEMAQVRKNCAHALSPAAHATMLAAWQVGVMNSVSKTINLPKAAGVEDIEAIFMLGYDERCKAMTVYRDGSIEGQVLTPVQLADKTAVKCPYCGDTLVRADGCDTCPSCRWSKCDFA